MMVPIGAEQSISWQDNGGGELFQSGPKIRDNASNVLGMDGRTPTISEHAPQRNVSLSAIKPLLCPRRE